MIRIFRHYVPKTLLILGASELSIFFSSIYLGVTVRILDFNPTSNLLVGEVWTKALAYTLLMMLLMAAVGLYQRGLRDEMRGIGLRISVAFLLGLLSMGALIGIAPALSIGSGAFTVAFLTSFSGVMAFRAIVYRYSDRDIFKRRVLVLGAGRQARQIERMRRRTDWIGCTLVGYVPVGDDVVIDEQCLLRAPTTLLALVEAQRVDELVVAVGERRHGFPVNEVLDCKMSGVEVVDLLGFFEQQTGKINLTALNPSSLIFADGFIQAVIKSSVHRSVDIVLSLGFLLVAWPVMLLATAAVWMESGMRDPVLYRQVRVGRNGRHFEILKFRSMRVGAERRGVAEWARSDDARVTRVGEFIRRTRIDEMPQLLNVLKGEMSFVGPRPERPEFVSMLAEQIPFYALRHRVNPGITGWAQICYPYGASVHDAREKLQFELYYIKNYSLFLDIAILIQTVQVILWGQGAR